MEKSGEEWSYTLTPTRFGWRIKIVHGWLIIGQQSGWGRFKFGSRDRAEARAIKEVRKLKDRHDRIVRLTYKETFHG